MLVAIEKLGGKIAYINPDNLTGIFEADGGKSTIFHVDGSTTSANVSPEALAMMINQAEIAQHQEKYLSIERVRGC